MAWMSTHEEALVCVVEKVWQVAVDCFNVSVRPDPCWDKFDVVHQWRRYGGEEGLDYICSRPR